MVTIEDLHKMALELRSVDDALKKVSHYKVNRKIYDFMKTLEHEDIIYHAGFDALLLNKKPVYIDDSLEDGIATYKHKEESDNELINIYTSNMPMVVPRLVQPIVLSGII